MLRGIVMIIMVLDHTRVYFHADAFLYDPLDLSRTHAGLFATRWITHFCAPVFVFLAGTSAFLSGRRKEPAELTRFLFTRGLWLVFLELTIVNFGWFFHAQMPTVMLQVIWAIGMSMVVLSGLIRLPFPAVFATGLALVALHNLLDGIHFPDGSALSVAWSLLHEPGQFTFANGRALFVMYPILPWLGTMVLGYCFGYWYTERYSPTSRKRMLILTGTGIFLAFVALRASNLYGDPHPWTMQDTPLLTAMSFFSVHKYPPSLLYLMATLGPAILLLGFLEKSPGPVGNRVLVFGRVPLFYYLLHIYILHLAAIVAAVVTGYPASAMIFGQWVNYTRELPGYGFSLFTVYVVWIAVVVTLYPLCAWYEVYKKRNKEQVWLSYL